MISAIFFDYGGTLAYRSKPIEIIKEERFKNLYGYLINQGFDIKIEIFKEIFNGVWDSIYKKCEEESIEIPLEEIISKILEKINANNIDKKEAPYIFLKPDLECIKLFPEVKETLIFLKNKKYKIGLISNTISDLFIEEILGKFKIKKFFDSIVTSAQTRIRKPRPEIFKKALKELNVIESQAIMIGDSLKSDILGAKRLGIKTIYIKRSDIENNVNVTPDAIISNLLEIIPIISKWQDEKNGCYR